MYHKSCTSKEENQGPQVLCGLIIPIYLIKLNLFITNQIFVKISKNLIINVQIIQNILESYLQFFFKVQSYFLNLILSKLG